MTQKVTTATLVAGCYERFLFGYDHNELKAHKQGESVALNKSFVYPAHQGPVKCLDTAGGLVVSGGSDDQMHLYDIRHNKDLGFLMNPGEGAVTCVKFFNPPGKAAAANLLSGSADGSIHIWKAGGGWEHMKPMRGHRGAVNSLSIHPTGLMAISVAHDNFLKLWDLVKGRCTYTSKLELEGEIVQFGPLGADYTLAVGKKVTIHGVDGTLLATLDHDRKVGALQRTESLLLTGSEEGRVQLWDLRARPVKAVLNLAKAHQNRVRGIALPGLEDPTSSSPIHVATGSSDGRIRLWDTRMASSPEDSPSSGRQLDKWIGEAQTNARITSLVAVDPDSTRSKYANNLAAKLDVAIGSGGAEEGGKAAAPVQKKKDAPAAARGSQPASTSGRDKKGAPAAGLKKGKAKEEEFEEVAAAEDHDGDDEEESEEEEDEEEEEEQEGAQPAKKKYKGSERSTVWGAPQDRGRGFADIKEKRRKEKKNAERQRKQAERKKQLEAKMKM